MIFFMIQRNNLLHFQSSGWNNTLHHHHFQHYAQFNKKNCKQNCKFKCILPMPPIPEIWHFIAHEDISHFWFEQNVSLDPIRVKISMPFGLAARKIDFFFFFFQRLKKRNKVKEYKLMLFNIHNYFSDDDELWFSFHLWLTVRFCYRKVIDKRTIQKK